MKSTVLKRSVVVAGHKTSVSLEDAFWFAFREIADKQNMTLSELAAVIDTGRQHGNLSSAIRLFVLDFYRKPLPGRDLRAPLADLQRSPAGRELRSGAALP